MSIKPWISIPTSNAMVIVDHDVGDIRIIIKDSDTIDKAIADLTQLKTLVKEMEAYDGN